MFELTNEQRKCFGLLPVEDSWVRMELKPSPYYHHTTIAYRDGNMLRKFIASGEEKYTEYEICEQISDDLRYLLPKTEKGKPVLLSAAALEKRTGFGMCLSYQWRQMGYAYVDLYSQTSQKGYYSNNYDNVNPVRIEGFQHWVEDWCAETTQEDLADITAFAAQPRQHAKFREGDVFRFKINRRLYGYGRVLLDFGLMRKRKEPFWDILAGKPLICSAYHIATERQDVTLEELGKLGSLPSVHMMDNRLYYGDFNIIGNIPVGQCEDYPIMYGNSIDGRCRAVLLQCGKLYRRIDSGTALCWEFKNNGIGFGLGFHLPVLLDCIAAGSNAPYWTQGNWNVEHDLRNPKLRKQLEQICRQFDIVPSKLVK